MEAVIKYNLQDGFEKRQYEQAQKGPTYRKIIGEAINQLEIAISAASNPEGRGALSEYASFFAAVAARNGEYEIANTLQTKCGARLA